LLITSALVNGCDPKSTIAPLGFMTRSIASHMGANGITESHLQAVVLLAVGGISKDHIN
jgi:hypothetical protein